MPPSIITDASQSPAAAITYRLWLSDRSRYITFLGPEGSPAVDLDYGRPLGRGSFGQVHATTYRISTESERQPQWALKEGSGAVSELERQQDNLAFESRMFGAVYGTTPLLDFEISLDKYIYRLLMPRLPGIQVIKYLAKVRPDYIERLKIAIAILKAVKVLHEKGIIHGDLKTDNINIVQDQETGEYRVYILDFGLSYRVTDLATFFEGDSEYWTRDRVHILTDVDIRPRAHPFHDIFSLFYYLLVYEKGFTYKFITAIMPPLEELKSAALLYREIREGKTKEVQALKNYNRMRLYSYEMQQAYDLYLGIRSTRNRKKVRFKALAEKRREYEERAKESVTVEGLISQAERLLAISEYCLNKFNIFTLQLPDAVRSLLKQAVEFAAYTTEIDQLDDAFYKEINELCQNKLERELCLFFLKDENQDFVNLASSAIRERIQSDLIFIPIMAALDDETIESYRNITRTRRNYINTLIAYDDLQFILSFKGRAVEDFVIALPIIIEVEYERYIKISFTQVTLDAMIEKAEAIQVLKNEIISYCQSNVIAIGVFEDNVSFKTLLGNAHEFADKTTALEQFPETLLTSIRKIFNEKFNERLQNWFLTDDNNDIGKLTNAQIRQRLQAAPIFASVAINITEMRIQQNKELVQTRERLIKSYSELGLLSKLRFKTVTLEACKREFVASNWNPVVVESITEATLNRIKAEHNRTMPTSFLPFYQLHPIDWASIRVNLVATLIIIKEYSKISVDIEASITALIKDLSVESGDPANNLIRLYNIYQELNVYEKMALQGAFNMPIASSELGEPTFRFIFKAGFDPKLFGPALLTVLKEIPRPATTFSLWFSRYRPWYDEIQRGLEKLMDDQDKITDQQFGCFLAKKFFYPPLYF